MKTTTLTAIFVCLLALASSAQTYNNYKKEYLLTSQTNGAIEARRTHRLVLCDSQPSGLYVRKGEQLSIVVTGLDLAYTLSTMIGFKPMWGNRNNTQEVKLRNGANTVTASQAGILSFIFVKSTGYDTRPTTVKVSHGRQGFSVVSRRKIKSRQLAKRSANNGRCSVRPVDLGQGSGHYSIQRLSSPSDSRYCRFVQDDPSGHRPRGRTCRF